MKYLRFLTSENKTMLGRISPDDETEIISLTGDFLNGVQTSDEFFSFNDVQILPLTEPSKIISADDREKTTAPTGDFLNGVQTRNEAESVIPVEPVGVKNIKELPLIFDKLQYIRPLSSDCGAIALSPYGDALYCKGRLALIVAKPCEGITLENADEYIFGVACALTAGVKERSEQIYCAVGPYVETEFNTLTLCPSLFINGKRIGSSAVRSYSPQEVLCAVSRVHTLKKGDIVLLYATDPVPIIRGDVIQVKTEGVGTLVNITK